MSWITDSWFTDLYSLPYNAATGNLTDAQKAELVKSGRAEIQAVASSPGAQINSTVQKAAQQAADQQSAYVQGDVEAVASFSQCEHETSIGVGSICLDGLYQYKWWFIGAGVLLVLFVLAPYVRVFSGRK
jgi:hypothetical protein